MGTCYSKVVAEPFTNMIDQTINPGDEVVCVTTGYGHTVSVFTGKYVGVRRDNVSNNITGAHIVDIPVEEIERVICDDGEFEETRYVGYDKNWRSIYEKTGRRYNKVKRIRYRKSNLQLNRMFKVDTPLSKTKI